MRKALAGLLLLGLISVSTFAQTPAQETPPPTSSRIKTPKFKTEDEAIEHYRLRMNRLKPDSFASILELLEIPPSEDTQKLAQTTDPLCKMFADKSGKLLRVDVCKVPKLGDTIQRAGFILLFEHNLGFVDVWFINTQLGWHLSNFNYNFDTDVTITLEKIPEVYFQK